MVASIKNDVHVMETVTWIGNLGNDIVNINEDPNGREMISK